MPDHMDLASVEKDTEADGADAIKDILDSAEPKEEEAEEAGSPDEPVEVVEEAGSDDEPAPDHPRFKEIYGKLKDQERNNKRMQADMEMMRRHNEKLNAQMEEAQAPPDVPEPDIEVDPQGWRQWKTQEDRRWRASIEAATGQRLFDSQKEDMRDQYTDYDEVIGEAMPELDRPGNETVREKVMGAANPPRAAYRWAKKHLNQDAEERDSLDVEAGAPSSEKLAPKKVGLNKEEKRLAKQFGLTPEEWVKQRDILDKQRG